MASRVLEVRRSRKPSDGLRLRRALIGAIVVVLGGIVYGTADDISVRTVFPLLYIAVALQFLPLLWSRDADPFSPPAYVGLVTGTALVAVLGAMLATQRLEFAELPLLSAARREEVMNLVCLAYVVGTLSYYGGYYLHTPRHSHVTPSTKAWIPKRLLAITLLCGALFVPAYAYFQSRVGASLTELALAEGKDVWKEDPTLSWMHRGIALGFIPVLLHGAAALRVRAYKKLVALAVVALILAFLSVRVGTRGNAVFFLLNLLMLVHYLWRRIPSSLLMFGGLMLIVVLNILGSTRRDREADLDVSADRFKPGQALVEHENDRQRLTAASVVMVNFPDWHDYLLGRSWTAVLVAPIPRPLLPDKNSYLKWSDSGITYSLVGVPAPTPFLFLLYANFGWFGIVGGMAAWGVFHRRLQAWRERANGDVNVTLLYAAVLIYFTPTLLSIGICLQTVVPIAASLWFIGRRTRLVGVQPSRVAPA